MAVKLNKNRIQESWIVFAFCIALIFLSKPWVHSETSEHMVVDLIGFFLVLVCVFGRVYTTAFLGGHKNVRLINYGPFSIVRNPLYVFSMIGVLGVSIFTQRPWIMLIGPVGVTVIYYYLVKREEGFLLSAFGDEYAEYCRKVPRFIPNFSLYSAPELVNTSPSRLLNAVFDAFWWFAVLGVLEYIERFGL